MSKKAIELIGDPEPQLLHYKPTHWALESIFNSDTPCSVDEFVERVEQMRQELEKKGWSNLYLKMNNGYETSDIAFFGSRLENTDEIELRLAAAEVKKTRLAKRIQKAKDFLKDCGELDD